MVYLSKATLNPGWIASFHLRRLVRHLTGLFVLCFLCSSLWAQQVSDQAFNDLLLQAKRSNSQRAGLSYAKAALSLAETPERKMRAMYTVARVLIGASHYTNAQRYLTEAFAIARETGDKRFQSLLLLEKGRCLQFSGASVEALKFLLAGMRLQEGLNDSEVRIRGHVYLAEYYRSLTKHKDALTYMHQALALARLTNPEADIRIQMYNRAAAIHSEMRHTDSSLYYSYLALKLSRDQRNVHQEAVSLNEIGFMLENFNQMDQALKNYSFAEAIWRNYEDKRYWINVLGNSARVYTKLHKYQKSNELLFSILKIAQENNWYENIQGACDLLEVNYTNIGDLKSAYYYKALGMEAKLNVYQEDNAKELEEIKTKYKTEKNEILMRKQQREIEIANRDIVTRKNEAVRLWIGFVLVLLLCVYIFYLLMQRSKSNTQLNLRNLEIEQSNVQLKANLAQIETLIQEVHHRVKNNLQFIYSILELEIDTNRSATNVATLKGMQTRIMAMSLVHELLYTKDSLEKVSSVKYINDLTNFLDMLLNTEVKKVAFELQVDEVMLDINQSIAIGMILSELVGNAFKHAFASQPNPQIRIRLAWKSGEQEALLEAEDNGNGYNPQKVSGEGLGFRLIRIFAAQLGGSYRMDTGKQFLFTLKFPMQT